MSEAEIADAVAGLISDIKDRVKGGKPAANIYCPMRYYVRINPETWSVRRGEVERELTHEDVYHGRKIEFGIPKNGTWAALRKILLSSPDRWKRIVAGYLGECWDGNNVVGDWSEDAIDAMDAIEDEISTWETGL